MVSDENLIRIQRQREEEIKAAREVTAEREREIAEARARAEQIQTTRTTKFGERVQVASAVQQKQQALLQLQQAQEQVQKQRGDIGEVERKTVGRIQDFFRKRAKAKSSFKEQTFQVGSGSFGREFDPKQLPGQVPTRSEVELQQSLLPELRELPTEQVRQLQIQESQLKQQHRQLLGGDVPVIEQRGGIFFKPSEVGDITTQEVPSGQLTQEQRQTQESIQLAGEILGIEKPEEKVAFVPEKKLEEGRPKTIIGKAVSDFELGEKMISEKVTKPFFEKVPEEVIAKALLGRESLVTPKPVREFQEQFLVGALEDVKEQPLKQVVLFGVGGGITVAGKGVGFGLKTVAGQTGIKAGEVLFAGGGITLAGLFGLETARELKEAKTFEEKSKVLGVATKDIALLGLGARAGEVGLGKAVDIFRVRGKEVSAEKIIAPEFFEGQTFPKLKRGQTAGELAREFKQPIKEIGEVEGSLRGFTATPTAFAKDTVTGRGTSELPGLFSAPKVSPRFLRIESEKKVIGLKGFLDFPISEAIRVKFKSLELAPGIKPSQKRLRALDKPLRKFFEDVVGTGRTVLPFIKTEKEVITAADTPLKFVGQKFFFKFKERKIPIREFEVLGAGKPLGKIKKVKGTKITTLEKEVLRSSRTLSSSPALNPLSISPLGISRRQRGRDSKISSISRSVSKSSSKISSSVSRGTKEFSRISAPSTTRRQRTTTRRPPLPLPDITIPPTKKKGAFDLDFKIPKLKKKKDKGKRREKLLLVEGFTAKELQLPKQLIKEKDLFKEFERRRFDVGIKRAPILIK